MWKTAKLGDVADIKIGKTPPRKNAKYWDKEKVSGNVWLSIADLTASKGRYVSDSKEYVSDEGAALFKVVPKATLIMSFKLSIGKLAFTDKDLRTNEAIAALRIKDENILTKEYLYHALSLINWERLAGDDVKVKGKTLNKAKLKKIRFLLPALAEQQRIVAKLDAVFAEIDVVVAAVKRKSGDVIILEKMAYDKLFEKLSFSSPTVKLGAHCNLVRGPFGGSLKKNTFVASGYAVYEQQHAINNQCRSFRYFIDTKKYEEMKRFTVNVGDILMSCSGTIGKTTIVPGDAPAGIINQALLKITPKPNVNSDFLSLYMSTSFFNNQLMDGVDGAAIQNVASVKVLKEIELILPLLEIQNDIVAKANVMAKHIRELSEINNRKFANLNALKSAILAQELYGKAA